MLDLYRQDQYVVMYSIIVYRTNGLLGVDAYIRNRKEIDA